MMNRIDHAICILVGLAFIENLICSFEFFKNIIEIYIPDPKLISQLKLKVYIS
jgi:hypothetical protein